MGRVVLDIVDVSKQYRLGVVGTGTLSHDLNRWWAMVRGKEDPYRKVGQINDRTKRAQGDYVWALQNVTLEVPQGEVLGVIGCNGAGKSTLLKLISRITAPTSGLIRARGRMASLLEVGTGMHPEMTARENIYLNGAILGMKKREIEAKFDDIVAFSGCSMYVDTPLKRFSSGMKVRIGFSVAAFLEPDIMIVDEVLAVGDREFQKRAIGKMQDVSHATGRTVLFVSHDMSAIKRLCDRVVHLSQGTVQKVGSPESVVGRYLEDGMATEGTVFDLLSMARRGDYGRRARLQSLVFNHGEPIRHREELRIDVGFQSFDRVDDFEVHVTFRAPGGARLLMVRSDLAGAGWRVRRGGAGTVSFICPEFPLTPSTYVLDIAARAGGRTSLDHLSGAATVMVLPGDRTKPVELDRGSEGVIVLEGTWSCVEHNGVAVQSPVDGTLADSAPEPMCSPPR